MKSLKFLGKIILSNFIKKIPHERQKEIRKTINPSKICDLCLSNYKHQTIFGQILCSRCYNEYRNEQTSNI
jgi:protein-arginine kinase activator protein McsA